jgi:hypothetical protein
MPRLLILDARTWIGLGIVVLAENLRSSNVSVEDDMDDTTQRAGADRSRINVNEDYELAYWTRTLEVPEDELRNAVQQVGTLVEAVKKYLGRPAA